VRVGVAIGAVLKFHPINRRLALWDVALPALQGSMFALQRIGGRGVRFRAERRWLESIKRVAVRALASADRLPKLTAMRIGVMAIRTLTKTQRLFEVTERMATVAFHQ